MVIVWFTVAIAVIFSKWHYLPEFQPSTAGAGSDVQAVGELLLSRHLLAFELISVIMLMALVGAIIIAREDKQPGGNAGGTMGVGPETGETPVLPDQHSETGEHEPE